MASRTKAKGPVPDHDLKIVMVGSIGVGKTSLVCRFVKDTFREFLTTTIGASYMFKNETINSELVKYSLWDTAGQEQFHSLVPLYFRDAHGVVMVVDATRPQSVVDDIKIWLDKVRAAAPSNVTVYVATNKIDMEGAEEAEEVAKEFATQQGFLCGGVSAKTGQGVPELYRTLAEACIEKIKSGSSSGPGDSSSKTTRSSAGPRGTVPAGDESDEDTGEVKVGYAKRTSGGPRFKLSNPPSRRQGQQKKTEKCKC